MPLVITVHVITQVVHVSFRYKSCTLMGIGSILAAHMGGWADREGGRQGGRQTGREADW